MKKKITFLYLTIVVLICSNLLSSCVGDSYYDKLNSTPTISISSQADTVKISAVATSKEVSAIVSCSDYNMNMRSLSYSCDNGADILLFDANIALNNQVQIGNNIENFEKKITFRPQKDGDYVINFKVKDAFTTRDSVQYKVHAFTNMIPVVATTSCVLSGNTLSLDLSASYDVDKKFGGAVTGYLVYIGDEKVMDFSSPKMNVILSPAQLSNLASKLTIAVRDNDGQLSTIVKPTLK